MPGPLMYFLVALFFLLVCILAVPGDGADLPGKQGPPLASGALFLVSPAAQGRNQSPMTQRIAGSRITGPAL